MFIPDDTIEIHGEKEVGIVNGDTLSKRPRNHAIRFIVKGNFKIRSLPSFTMYPPIEKYCFSPPLLCHHGEPLPPSRRDDAGKMALAAGKTINNENCLL